MTDTRKTPLDYEDTVDLMLSDSDTDRLKAEYKQLLIRWNRLETYRDSLPLEGEKYAGQDKILSAQDYVMVAYMNLLKLRAELEGVTLK